MEKMANYTYLLSKLFFLLRTIQSKADQAKVAFFLDFTPKKKTLVSYT